MPFKKQPELYSVWMSMKNRCLYPSNPQFKDYGGRGITVCERWLHSYATFAADMGPRPGGYLIDRIDNDKGYFPENCRWVDRKTSQRNQRTTRMVSIGDKSFIAAELAEISGLKTGTIINRAAEGRPYEEVIASTRFYSRAGLALGGYASGLKQKAKTHCPQGHPYDEANTAHRGNWRRCKRCCADRENARRKRLAADSPSKDAASHDGADF